MLFWDHRFAQGVVIAHCSGVSPGGAWVLYVVLEESNQVSCGRASTLPLYYFFSCADSFTWSHTSSYILLKVQKLTGGGGLTSPTLINGCWLGFLTSLSSGISSSIWLDHFPGVMISGEHSKKGRGGFNHDNS